MSSETPHSDDIDPVQLYLSEVNRRMGMKLFLAPLSVLAYRVLRHRLGWEQVPAVHSCAIYWHFLEGVWVVLFGLLLLTA
jgi:heme/copper-type cytochrome/quinol oxidase subunit 3